MRKFVAIPGIILITVVLLINGPAVAQPRWHFAVAVEDYERCVDPENALGQDDNDYASLGSTPFEYYGWIILDLGEDNEMGALQLFWVFADSSVTEDYDVYVGATSNINDFVYLSWGKDNEDYNFTTPSYIAGDGWRYVYIEATHAYLPGDPYYGPEVDAVGFYGPP